VGEVSSPSSCAPEVRADLNHAVSLLVFVLTVYLFRREYKPG
jgi:hypothetical protein